MGIYYFSSSSDKDFIKSQKENKLNYKYKVIKIFKDRKQALELEIKLHNKFNVGINESFYNRSKQTSTGFDRSGIKLTNEHKNKISITSSNRIHSEESKKLISEAHKNIKKTPEHRQNLSKSRLNGFKDGSINKLIGDKNPMYKRTHSDETKLKISKANKGKILSDETKAKIAQSKIGINRKEEDKQKISENRKGKCLGESNAMTKTISIYNENDELIYTSKGSFKKFCEDNNLPFVSFRKNFNKKIYQSKLGPHYAKKNGFEKYIGWCAKD